MKFLATTILALLSINLISYAELNTELKELAREARQGNADAQYAIGSIFATYNTPQDNTDAAKWFRKAAEQGLAEAQFNLGVSYHNGIGVPKDYNEAAIWYRKAAEQGMAVAQFNLGLIYEYGKGVPINYSDAAKWYRKAGEQGLGDAQHNLGNFYENGKGVTKDYTQAAKWYRKAAERGQAASQHNLGNFYVNGKGVAKDYTEAANWYRKAAEQGLAESQNYLGLMYATGKGVAQDDVLAYMWLDLASAKGIENDESKLFLIKRMSLEQNREARNLSREWLAKHSSEAQSASDKIRLMADTLRARDSGNLDLAKEKAEELIKIAPKDENVQRLLASINTEAQSASDKIRLMADTLRARDSGNLDLAKEKAEELIKIAPKDENVQRLLASVNKELEKEKE